MNKRQKILLIGGGIGVVALGVLVFIYRKQITIKTKSVLKKQLGGTKWFDEGLAWYRNQKNKDLVNKLHPLARNKFKEFMSRAEKELGLKFILTSGYRTFEHQARLKKQNSKNASAGHSSHNYGFALDMNIINKNGRQLMKKDSTADWKASGIVDLAKNMGFKWGGDFASYHDPIHFYLEPLPRAELLSLHKAGQKDGEGYVLSQHIPKDTLIAFDGSKQYIVELID